MKFSQYVKNVKKIKHLFTAMQTMIGWLSITMVGFLIQMPSAFAEDDALASVKKQVISNFGANSTIVLLLLTLEAFAVGYRYHKTHNVGELAGLVVLAIFLNWALIHYLGG